MADYVLVEGDLFHSDVGITLEKANLAAEADVNSISYQLVDTKEDSWYLELTSVAELLAKVPYFKNKFGAPKIKAQLIVRIVE